MDVWSLDSRDILENDNENALTNPSKVMFSVFFHHLGFHRGHALQKNPRCFGLF